MTNRIGFIGAGQMARALASGFVRAGQVAADAVTAGDPAEAARAAFQSAVPGARLQAEPQAVVGESDIVFLAVKPQHLEDVFTALRPGVSSGKLFVSIVAGATLGRLADGFGTERIVRVMPNTPCLIGRGAAGFALGSGATQSDAAIVKELLEAVGLSVQLPEPLLDAVTGLSGSGPAFVYQFIEALSDGGVRVGLPRDVATKLAAHTVMGAAAMVLETAEHPGVLKDRVASPGGTTIAGLHALESGGLRAAVINAVQAAAERSRDLG